MAHKKGGGPHFKVRTKNGRRYPSAKYKCELRRAPNCRGYQNAHTAKDPVGKVCNRCYQSLVSKRGKG